MNVHIRPRRFLTLGWGYWWESTYNNLYVEQPAVGRVAVADVRLHVEAARERGELALAQLLQCYADSALPVPLADRIADQLAGVGLVDVLERIEREAGDTARVHICPFLRGLEGLLYEQTLLKPGTLWRFDGAGRASFVVNLPVWWLESSEVTA